MFTTWITSLDSIHRSDHAVTDEEYAARLAENRSVFQAVCGAGFLPRPMEECRLGPVRVVSRSSVHALSCGTWKTQGVDTITTAEAGCPDCWRVGAGRR